MIKIVYYNSVYVCVSIISAGRYSIIPDSIKNNEAEYADNLLEIRPKRKKQVTASPTWPEENIWSPWPHIKKYCMFVCACLCGCL